MQLTLTNYGVIGSAEYSLQEGITVVIGRNGKGKSTFVDALYFAFTGETIDGQPFESRINWDALEQKAAVTLKNDDFVITRNITPRGVNHELKPKNADVISKKKEVSDFICKYYGLESLDLLKAVFFSAQFKAIDVVVTTALDRLSMLSSVFGFNRIEEGRAALYKILGQTPELQVNAELIESLGANIGTIESNISTTSAEIQTLNADIKALAFNIADYSVIQNKPLVSDVETKRTELEQLKVDLVGKQQILVYAQDALKTANESADLLRVYNQYTAAMTAYTTAKTALESAVSPTGFDLEAMTKMRQTVLQKQVECRAAQDSCRKDMAFMQDGKCPITHDIPCPALVQMYDPAILQGKIDEQTAVQLQLDTDLSAIDSIIANHQKAVNEYRRLETAFAVAEAALNSCAKPAEGFEPERVTVVTADVLQKLKQDVVTAEAFVTQNSNNIAVLESWLTKESAGAVTVEQKQLWAQKQELNQTLSQKLAVATANLSSLQNSLQTTTTTLDALKKDQKRAEKVNLMRRIMSTLRDVMSRQNLQKSLLDESIQNMNFYMAQYAKTLCFSYPVQLNSDGGFLYADNSGEWRNVALLSGGQKYIVATIWRLAVAATLESRYPFVVLDEPTTGLDADNCELLAGMLERIGGSFTSDGKLLFIPTHERAIVNVANNTIQM